MRRSLVVSSLAAAVLGLTGLAGCTASDAGPVPGRTAADPAGTTLTAIVPAGDVEVVLGDGVDEVEADQAADDSAHQAPSGQDYLPVHVALGVGDPAVVDTADTVFVPAAVSIVIDGEQHELPSPYSVGADGQLDLSPSTTYVPTDSTDPDDVQLVVEYDGLEQRVGPGGGREAGAAEAYYDGSASTGGSIDCSELWSTPPRVEASLGCTLEPTITPYLPGVGWAETGQVYVGVNVEIVLSELTRDGRTPPVQKLRLDASLEDGSAVRPPATVGVQPPTLSRDTVVRSVFFAAPSTGTHVLAMELSAGDITLTTRIPLGSTDEG